MENVTIGQFEKTSFNKTKRGPLTVTLDSKRTRSSKKEHKADALALRADERRDKLR